MLLFILVVRELRKKDHHCWVSNKKHIHHQGTDRGVLQSTYSTTDRQTQKKIGIPEEERLYEEKK